MKMNSHKLIVSCVCLLLVLPCYAQAGWAWGRDKYPLGDTSATGGVVVNGETIPFDIPILTTDWVQTIDPVSGDPYYSVTKTNIQILSGTTVVATIDELNLVVDFDPYVRLNFAVTAGAADTTFMLNSSVVSFPTLNSAPAYASAGLTLTGNGDGAWVNGGYSGETFKAIYNGSSVYDTLLGSFTGVPDDTTSQSDRSPTPTGWTTMSGPISSIQSQFSFTLSASDSASGTSRFEVKVPEPATMILLGLGSLALIRKRSA